MQSTTYKLTEFFIFFILIPISFVLSFPVWIKMGLSITGFIYVIYVLLKIEKNKFKIKEDLHWKLFFKATTIKFIIIAIITTVFVYLLEPSNLFKVLVNKPLLWLVLLVVYSVFSVYPQELIYRTFYFQRYESLFKNKNVFIFLNATVFCLAHLFFRNVLVIIITFFGGLLFAFTFNKTKSTLLVTIEHAVYGCWLFTVGMGELLGFPS
ncbi:CPBP family intramembrane metalloprotease [Lacinutrix neustonica]|uniref:CPBP family intramembrane metalloprotease n=1 Tax=Lacinutrix neustonica TaxID=2980107 RepID=A0A9E8MWM0_9FLAO|nr:CPBP family intramembrane glutamic endopeptidase [Lacinutrix neustonica]WAC02681.1 CPBP family intramembrane metalloprotease [Lacinutrix neustonica]